jgi:hypothetical protein
MRRTRLTLLAWFALALFDFAALAGFARIHAFVRTRRVNPRPRSRIDSPADIVWAVDEACVWYVKRAACLQRSAVATCLLRRSGHAATLVVGCRAVPFESHAWVEVGGLVVNDRPEYQTCFRVLERL